MLIVILIEQLQMLIIQQITLFFLVILANSHINDKFSVTTVTFLYDLNIQNMKFYKQKNMQSYLKNFESLLQTQSQLIIIGDQKYLKFVKQRTQHKTNIMYIVRPLQQFTNKWYCKNIQNLIKQAKINPNTVSSELLEKPQFKIQNYACLYYSKIDVITELAEKLDIWSTDFFTWMDADLAVSYEKVTQYFNKPLFNSPTILLDRIPFEFSFNILFHTNQQKDKLIGKIYPDDIQHYPVADYFVVKAEYAKTIKQIMELQIDENLRNRKLLSQQGLYGQIIKKYPYFTSYVQNFNLVLYQSLAFYEIYKPTVFSELLFDMALSIKQGLSYETILIIKVIMSYVLIVLVFCILLATFVVYFRAKKLLVKT